MHGITFILAFTVLLCGSSMAGSTTTLPNAGLFVFGVPPITAPASMIVASR